MPEDFTEFTADALRAEWHKEYEVIKTAQARQVALCNELDNRGKKLPKGEMG